MSKKRQDRDRQRETVEREEIKESRRKASAYRNEPSSLVTLPENPAISDLKNKRLSLWEGSDIPPHGPFAPDRSFMSYPTCPCRPWPSCRCRPSHVVFVWILSVDFTRCRTDYVVVAQIMSLSQKKLSFSQWLCRSYVFTTCILWISVGIDVCKKSPPWVGPWGQPRTVSSQQEVPEQWRVVG